MNYIFHILILCHASDSSDLFLAIHKHFLGMIKSLVLVIRKKSYLYTI